MFQGNRVGKGGVIPQSLQIKWRSHLNKWHLSAGMYNGQIFWALENQRDISANQGESREASGKRWHFYQRLENWGQLWFFNLLIKISFPSLQVSQIFLSKLTLKLKVPWGLPWNLVGRTPVFQCRGPGLIPGQGTNKIPHAAWWHQTIKSVKQTNKQTNKHKISI